MYGFNEYASQEPGQEPQIFLSILESILIFAFIFA